MQRVAMYNVKASNLCLPTTIKGGLGSAESRATLCSFYRDTLLHDCMEFWFPRAHDVEYGGFFTSLGRDGALLDSDKSIWFQGRMTWMLATMYLEFEPREEWLRLAKSGIEFLDRYGYAFTGPMYFLVTREGAPLRQRQHYIFSEAFAVIAYAAYGRAIESNYCIEKAQTLLRKIVATLATPGKLLPKVRPLTRPLKGVATPMILLVTAQELRKAVDDPLCTQIINEVIDEIERDFVNEEFKCVLENVGTNGEFYDTWDGRQVNPGHSIELGWFILEEARYRGGDAALTSLGLRIIEWSLKLGWDNKFGGLYYFRDARGLPCTEYWHDMKFWWPHCEALIATLLATKLTGEAHYAAWHEKVFEWSFEHFSDRKWGEWYGYLHRDGTVSTTIKGNHWKGFFHLPRMLLKCWGELQEFNPLQPCGMNTNLMSEKGGVR